MCRMKVCVRNLCTCLKFYCEAVKLILKNKVFRERRMYWSEEKIGLREWVIYNYVGSLSKFLMSSAAGHQGMVGTKGKPPLDTPLWHVDCIKLKTITPIEL